MRNCRSTTPSILETVLGTHGGKQGKLTKKIFHEPPCSQLAPFPVVGVEAVQTLEGAQVQLAKTAVATVAGSLGNLVVECLVHHAGA